MRHPATLEQQIEAVREEAAFAADLAHSFDIVSRGGAHLARPARERADALAAALQTLETVAMLQAHPMFAHDEVRT